MFSRDSENGVTLELEFLQTPCIRQFSARQIHLESNSSKVSTINNLHSTVYASQYFVHFKSLVTQVITKFNSVAIPITLWGGIKVFFSTVQSTCDHHYQTEISSKYIAIPNKVTNANAWSF